MPSVARHAIHGRSHSGARCSSEGHAAHASRATLRLAKKPGGWSSAALGSCGSSSVTPSGTAPASSSRLRGNVSPPCAATAGSVPSKRHSSVVPPRCCPPTCTKEWFRRCALMPNSVSGASRTSREGRRDESSGPTSRPASTAAADASGRGITVATRARDGEKTECARDFVYEQQTYTTYKISQTFFISGSLVKWLHPDFQRLNPHRGRTRPWQH
eukprot:scaffold25732_cov70-Phaeocystis_antarctica.AAC.4